MEAGLDLFLHGRSALSYVRTMRAARFEYDIHSAVKRKVRYLVAGDGRLEAAKLLGLAEAPVIRLDHLTPQQAKAYMLADNKLTDRSNLDDRQVAIVLKELSDIALDFEIEATGFEPPEIDLRIQSLDPPEVGDPTDDFDVADGPAISRPGDLWRLGPHRLLCGSALEPQSYDALLAGEKAASVFTDIREMTATIRALACEALNVCVWVKTNGGMGALYRSRYELVFAFGRTGERRVNNVQLGKHGRNRTNVWNYPGMNSFARRGRTRGLDLHPTVKPVAMVSGAILDVTERGDVVLDPFCGSGTTLVAAERTGRVDELIGPEGPILAIAPAANWPPKTWPAERFAEPAPGCSVRTARRRTGAPAEWRRRRPLLRAHPVRPASVLTDRDPRGGCGDGLRLGETGPAVHRQRLGPNAFLCRLGDTDAGPLRAVRGQMAAPLGPANGVPQNRDSVDYDPLSPALRKRAFLGTLL